MCAVTRIKRSLSLLGIAKFIFIRFDYRPINILH